MNAENIALSIEIMAVVFGLAYLYFLIKEKRICWLFGIASSLLSIILFYQNNLYSEAILFVYYVIIGVYGFWLWTTRDGQNTSITIVKIPKKTLWVSIVLGALGAISLGWFFTNFTDADSPYFDATTTAFSFVASYLEVKKYIAAWLFWIVINGATIFLYLTKDLNIYTLLTIVYFGFSFYGFWNWREKYRDTVPQP
ncbi:nicotinamide riboside transporter PnuC [Maribacter sp. R77961]|uniref:nicotinamide riboside transporter PnuC n=1 Tax=Maribacter sp. R77961 TaxID=3093871 RepID=UPI0037CC4450